MFSIELVHYLSVLICLLRTHFAEKFLWRRLYSISGGLYLIYGEVRLVNLHRYNQTYLCWKLKGHGDIMREKVWFLCGSACHICLIWRFVLILRRRGLAPIAKPSPLEANVLRKVHGILRTTFKKLERVFVYLTFLCHSYTVGILIQLLTFQECRYLLVTSVQLNLRNVLPRYGSFFLKHPV